MGYARMSEIRHDDPKIHIEQGKFVPFVTKDEVTNGFLQLENKIDNKFNIVDNKFNEFELKNEKRFNEIERKIDSLSNRMWFIIGGGSIILGAMSSGIWWLIQHVATK